MAKRSAGSKNRGKSLLSGGSGNVQFDTSQIFIGVVDHIIKKDSEDRQTYLSEDSEISDYVDNRNVAYIIPIDKNTPDTLVKAYFMNSHNIDMPMVSEAVLCCKTSVGYIVIDRFSPNAFGTNFELSDYLLSKKLSGQGNFQGISVEASKDLRKKLGVKPIEEVAPFFQKEGANVFFGRNNQYMIFDYGSRINADDQEQQYSEEGSFVKLGLKQDGEQVDTKEDPSVVVLGKDTKVQSLLEANIESEYNVTEDGEPENGMGIQSDQLVFFGREFIVIYSQRDMLIHGEGNLYLDFKKIVNKADRINLGKNAKQPIVLGNEFVDMMNELVSIILDSKHLTKQGPTLRISPETEAKLRKFKAQYLRQNNSPVHSQRTFSD